MLARVGRSKPGINFHMLSYTKGLWCSQIFCFTLSKRSDVENET